MVDADSTESAGQPGTEPSTCWICYDDDSVGGQLLRSGCACHGACAFVHLRCLVSAADASAYREDDDFWVACPTCKEMRSGPAQLGLARVRWGLVKSRPDWDYARQSACTEMAVAHIEAGDFASAQTFREELLAVDRRMHGDEHPQTVSSLTNLGKILSMRCEYGKAREIVESALRTVQESTLCQQLEAEARAQAAAETDGKVCPDGSLTAAIKMELGSIYLELGDYDKAHRHFEEAVALEEDVLSVDSTWTICAKNYLGEALRRKGQLEEAKKLLQHTRDGFRRAMGADHPETIGALADIGQVNLNLGLFEVADDALKQGLERSMRILGKMHSLTLTFMSLLGELRLEQRQLDAAVGFLVPALEAQRSVLARRCPTHVAVLNTLSRLGRTWTAIGGTDALEKAVEALQECVVGRLALFGPDHPKVDAAQIELKAATAARAPGIAKSKPRSNDKSTTAADSEVKEPILQQWLGSKEDDTATTKLDLEVAELIEELQPKYPEYTWRDHLYMEDEHPYILSFFVGIIVLIVVWVGATVVEMLLLDYILIPACDGTLWLAKEANSRNITGQVGELLVNGGIPESFVPSVLMGWSPASSSWSWFDTSLITESLLQQLRIVRKVTPPGDVDITEVSCADLFHICLRQMPPFVQSGYLRTAIFGVTTSVITACYFFELENPPEAQGDFL